MNWVRVRTLFTSTALACAGMLLLACGNYHPNHIAFSFTPVSVTAFPDGTPTFIDPKTCESFAPDKVSVFLDAKERASFERWLDDISFDIMFSSGSPSQNAPLRFSYLLCVPFGSVPDAITLIAKQRGVLEASTFGGGGGRGLSAPSTSSANLPANA